jgi:putative transposase
MKYNPDILHRRSIRLKGYDYAREGAYFITVCTKAKEWLFGEVINGEMRLNDMGTAILQCWKGIPKHFPNAVLDEFIVMPNHIHGIIIFTVGAKNISPDFCDDKPDRAKNISPIPCVSPIPCYGTVGAKDILLCFIDGGRNRAKNISPLQHGTTMTIGSVIRGFKIGVTKWARVNGASYNPWQRNYYEHIIRNETELNKIREYVINNPLNWETDENFKAF